MGGTFIVEIFFPRPHPTSPSPSSPSPAPTTTTTTTETPVTLARVLWDRARDGGFPETKELKRRVRDVIEPGRDLGHVDRDHRRPAAGAAGTHPSPAAAVAGAAEKGGEGEGEGKQEEEEKKKKTPPSRAELEAAGQAGGGYPGSGEAAAQLVGDVRRRGGEEGKEGKAGCEDCA